MNKLLRFLDNPWLFVGFLALVAVLVIVFLISAGTAAEEQFRIACAEVNGNAVWNGRNWECIK